ncbi:MAG: pseudouridine synthase [Bacteroidota bacterium]
MAKSPKNEQGNGKKFQVRQPGEKRNRKIDFDKTEPKKTKFFGENNSGGAPSRSRDKKSFGDRNDKPSFGNRFEKNNRFEGRDDNRRDNNRTGFSRGDKPSYGADRPARNNNPRFDRTTSSDDNARGGFKKGNPRFAEKGGFTGGDKSGNPRFPGDRSARFSKDGDNKKPFNDREGRGRFDKPRSFDKSRSFDKPGFSDKPRFDKPWDKDNNRGGFKKPYDSENKRNFDKPRSFDKPGFSEKPRFDKPREFGPKKDFGPKRDFDEKPARRNEEDRPSKPSANSGTKGLAKFKPRSFSSESDSTQDFQEVQKTYGIPKAEKADTPKGFKGSKREFNRVSNNLEKGAEHAKSNEIRLNRYIANSGICSRREADELILQGLVRVNGEVVNELGTKVKPHDNVKVEDRKVIPEKPVYIIMNKPKGYITTTDDPEGRKTVMDLIDLPGKERIYPIGRLDRNTTGVLLLTNDGEMTQKLMHPSFEIKKVYRATLDRKPSKEHMLQLVEGVELEDGMMAFEQCGFVEEGKETVLGIEIKSGRNRIVRRMFEHFGYEVTALDRVLLGEFDKVKLGRGKWRFLTEKEMNYVDRLKRTKAKAPK